MLSIFDHIVIAGYFALMIIIGFVFKKFNSEFKNIYATIGKSLVQQKVAGPSNRYKKDVGEHRAVQALKPFDNERDKFNLWNDKLLNALSLCPSWYP